MVDRCQRPKLAVGQQSQSKNKGMEFGDTKHLGFDPTLLFSSYGAMNRLYNSSVL
jgi:hypothetical protein